MGIRYRTDHNGNVMACTVCRAPLRAAPSYDGYPFCNRKRCLKARHKAGECGPKCVVGPHELEWAANAAERLIENQSALDRSLVPVYT